MSTEISKICLQRATVVFYSAVLLTVSGCALPPPPLTSVPSNAPYRLINTLKELKIIDAREQSRRSEQQGDMQPIRPLLSAKE